MPAAIIIDPLGAKLGAEERALFRDLDPLGFILFARHIQSPQQVCGLTAELRDLVGRRDAPILIDQEGGRVQRLKPPTWRAAPAARVFGERARHDLAGARRAVFLNHRLLAQELLDLGIDVDCAPVVDLSHAGAHQVIGDRAYSGDPVLVADLGRAAMEGLLAGGVQPIVKHIPGHGRALVDSHHALPRCATPLAELIASDFLPFRLLRDAPWAMTAHVVFEAVDPTQTATTSARVIEEVIRGHIGFDGLLISDDLLMRALADPQGDNTRDPIVEGGHKALAAGCDLLLHCNGTLEEKRRIAGATPPMNAAAERRFRRARAMVGAVERSPAPPLSELDAFLATA
jgi:beta-N-acetylhexosaminidase